MMEQTKITKIKLTLSLCCILFVCSAESTGEARRYVRYEDSHVSMACSYSIVLYGSNPQELARIADAAFAEIDRIDRLMSHYKNSSPLSGLNREAADHPVKVEPELFDFIARCLDYSRESDGGFDITVGPLMKAWGFFRGEGRMPTQTELAAALSRVGYRHVLLNDQEKTVQFDRAGVELDLGGIAKGYAVDRAVAILKQHKIESALVNACGSTIYGLGAPPGKSVWTINLRDPVDQRKTAMTIRLKNQALSVSGSYEKFFEMDGVRYSHIMDPRTGWPVQGVISVAVITSNGTEGDALDNVFYVQGLEWSKIWSKRSTGTEMIFFLPKGEKGWRALQLQNGSMRQLLINHRVNAHPRN